MDTLQKTIYKTLPQGIKMEIINNPEKYPEYSQVVDRLNSEMLKESISKVKDKLKLTKNRLALMNVFLSIYYHIKSHPPETLEARYSKQIAAWDNFSEISYPHYEEEIDNVEFWPKYMFLIYYTYIVAYEQFYNLKLNISVSDYILPFDRKKDKLIDYIYKTYHNFDKNITLDKFRWIGY